MTNKNKTILVVDDDSDMLKLIDRILVTAGHKVLLAQSPEEGRELMKKEPPHLIISDLQMAPENGFQFIQSVRSQKQLAHIPLLVLSALNDFNSVKKAIGLGVNDYVIKPLQAAMLLRKIKKALFNHEFARWEPLGDEKNIEGEFTAQVVALGETGYSLAGSFKLNSGFSVKFKCPEFSELRLLNCVQKITPIPNTYLSGGKFINQVTFIGINEEQSSKIRKFIAQRSNS